MAGMRNVLVHEYLEVDHSLVYSVVNNQAILKLLRSAASLLEACRPVEDDLDGDTGDIGNSVVPEGLVEETAGRGHAEH
jgi:hypothetical protein